MRTITMVFRVGQSFLCLLMMAAIQVHWSPGGFCRALQCVANADRCGCTFDDGSGVIDVSSITNKNGSPAFKDVEGTDKNLYSYNPCYPFNEGNCTEAAVCQISNNTKGVKTFLQLGDMDKNKWSYEESPNGNVTVYYEHTSQTPPLIIIQSFVTYICDPTATTPTLEPLGGDNDQSYFFNLRTKCACRNACSGSSGNEKLSGGSVLLIVFFVLLLLYLSAGMLYNRTQRQATGLNMLPNLPFWLAVFGYARDGCLLVTCRPKAVQERSYGDIN